MKIDYSIPAKNREGSLTVKQFQQLNAIEKRNYIAKLILVPKEELNLWDLHILKFYTIEPEVPKENKLFISMLD